MKQRARAIGCGCMLFPLFALVWFVGLFNRGTIQAGMKLEPVAHLTHPQMQEVSGLVTTSRDSSLMWAHNDSGNDPRLFCVGTSGEVVVPEPLREKGFTADPEAEGELFQGLEVQDSELVDWEAVARSGDTIYLAEMGNNLNARRHLGFYAVQEPDPRKDTEVKADRFIEVKYPDQKSYPPRGRWTFDCEAVFATDNHLYCITKNRPPYRPFIQDDSANLYRLSLTEPEDTLTKVDYVEDLGGWVTACDLSEDGEWLALLCESPVQGIWLFRRPSEGDKYFSDASEVKRFVFHGGGQLESLAFARHEDEELLVMLNEEKELFRVTLDKFKEVKR